MDPPSRVRTVRSVGCIGDALSEGSWPYMVAVVPRARRACSEVEPPPRPSEGCARDEIEIRPFVDSSSRSRSEGRLPLLLLLELPLRVLRPDLGSWVGRQRGLEARHRLVEAGPHVDGVLRRRVLVQHTALSCGAAVRMCPMSLVRRENTPVLPAADWSVVRIYPPRSGSGCPSSV
eukprot:1179016-Prorocentrum_minimum.AAC.1